jgi:hypothetical protein
VVLRRGSPARELEPTAAYRLEVGGEAPGRELGKIILNGPLTLLRSWLKG